MDNPVVTVSETTQEPATDNGVDVSDVKVESKVNLDEITSPTLRIIASKTSVADLQQCLKELKAERKIMFGNVSSELNPAWYIIAYSDSGVEAVLDKGISKRKNLLTGEIENLSSYSGSKKIWFLIYE